MNDLQMALVGLGVLIILVVILFNWWQERSMRKEAANRFTESESDPLMGDFQMDPEAILKSEPEQVIAVIAPIAKSSRQAPIPILVNDAPVEHFDHENAVTEAASAVAEFERDMAATIEEVEEPEAFPSNADTSWQAESEPQSEAAPSAELMEEAGLADSASIPTLVNETAMPLEVPGYAMHDEQIALPAMINQQIDLVALLYLQQPVLGTPLREFLLSLADLDKPIYVYGLGLDSVWCPLTREHEASKFIRAACSMQLADRSGQVSRDTLSRYLDAVGSLGHKLNAQIEWQGISDPIGYASELDQFCIEVDKMVGFHLTQGVSGPFTGTKFRGLAEASGLVLGEDGAFHYQSETGQRLFSVLNHDNNPFSSEMLRTSVIRGITFQLDIPRVKNCAEVFNHMVLIAKQMEGSLSGQLVDDKQRALGEIQIEKIRQQLKVIHATMVARGIIPGSPIALRLFA